MSRGSGWILTGFAGFATRLERIYSSVPVSVWCLRRSRGRRQTSTFGFLTRARLAVRWHHQSLNSKKKKDYRATRGPKVPAARRPDGPTHQQNTAMPLAFTSAPATVGEASRPLAGASSPVLWKAAVCAGGGGRVRSLRRRASATASAAASTKKGVPLGAGRRRRRGRGSARAARGPRGEGPGGAGTGRRHRGVSGLRSEAS